MKTNPKKIIQRASRRESERRPVTVYLTGPLFDDFRLRCEELSAEYGVKSSASRVLEDLMRDFLAAGKKKRG